MTKTLKDHEQDLASKVADAGDGIQVALLVATTFRKNLLGRAVMAGAVRGAILLTIADLIGAAVETADDFLKLDEVPQAPEGRIVDLDAIIGALPHKFERVSQSEIYHLNLKPDAVQLACQQMGRHLHLVLTDTINPDDGLDSAWSDYASLITIQGGDGNTIAIVKNRFGATS